MKLQCPHCGVKGSAEDSYSGRKVKCPKCQGLFELKPEMALDLPEDSPLVSALSPTPVESATPLGEVDMPVTADQASAEDEAGGAIPVEEAGEPVEIESEPELESTPPPEEEALDWEDIASEIDLQLAEGDLGQELEDTQEGDPASLGSFQDEFETPAGDLGTTVEEESKTGDNSDEDIVAELEEEPAKIEVTDPMAESLLLDPVEAEDIGQELENDLAEIEEKVETAENYADEIQQVQVDDEVELEPYGIDKEQCWQCGKEESLGEPFVAQDGRLYCAECAPSENMEETVDPHQDQAQDQDADEPISTDDATSPLYDTFSIGTAIREVWAKTKGAKGAIWAGSAIMYLVILVIVAGGAFLLPPLDSDLVNVTGLFSNILLQSVTNVFSALFTAGLLFMGVRKVVGDRISWRMTFKGFSYVGKIIVASLLQFILVSIGFLLLVIPGIYLIVGYAMTLPLIVDQGLSPWQAMEMSRKAVHKIWWKVAGLFILMGLLLVVSLIPLGIGLIWTWPMFIILVGVVYQHLFDYEEETI